MITHLLSLLTVNDGDHPHSLVVRALGCRRPGLDPRPRANVCASQLGAWHQ